MSHYRAACSWLIAVALVPLLAACSSSDVAPGSAGGNGIAGATAEGGSAESGAASGAAATGGTAAGGAATGGTAAGGAATGGTAAGGAATGGTAAGGAAGSSAAGGSAAGSSGAISGGGALTSGDMEPTGQIGMTAVHNVARANVQPAASPVIPPLTWSSTLATTAQTWADNCQFMHSGGKYGENLYASAGQQSTPQGVVSSWVSEVKNYDYATNACGGVCGHYTQVVWRKSARLGCGVSNCTKNSPLPGFSTWQLWVCNYDPPGNFSGQKPY